MLDHRVWQRLVFLRRDNFTEEPRQASRRFGSLQPNAARELSERVELSAARTATRRQSMGANNSIPIEVPSCTKCASPRGSSSKLDKLQSRGGTPTAVLLEEDTGPTGSGRKLLTAERLRTYTDERIAAIEAEAQSSRDRKALREFTDQRIAAMEKAQKPKKPIVMSVFGWGADPKPEPEPEPEPVKRHCFARCCESKKAHVFADQ